MSEHVAENARYWNAYAPKWVARGEHNWATTDLTWGIWRTPEAEVSMLPVNMEGLDAIELGCGTGYVSAWMARRGARVVGVDVSAEQLATARRLAEEHGVDVTLLERNAEATGLDDASFDFAISEYGAAIWCDPDVWVREAWRLLRPGGRLVFLGTHPLVNLCWTPDGEKVDEILRTSWWSADRMDWTEVEVEPGGIEFNRSPADWLRLFREVGFVVEDYLELRAGDDVGDAFGISAAWGRRFPAEQIWKLLKE